MPKRSKGGQDLDSVVSCRLTEGEDRQFREAADALGLSPSTYLRTMIVSTLNAPLIQRLILAETLKTQQLVIAVIAAMANEIPIDEAQVNKLSRDIDSKKYADADGAIFKLKADVEQWGGTR